MENNIIFVFPLCNILTQLKSELENDSTMTVFEVDMVDEYEQLIANLETSITFSTDAKKTSRYLSLCKNIVNKRNHLNIIVSKQLPSDLILSRMEKDGLNEALPDYTQLKTLTTKVNIFFKSIHSLRDKKAMPGAKAPEKIDTQSVQKIERLMSEEKSNYKAAKDLKIKSDSLIKIDTESKQSIERLVDEKNNHRGASDLKIQSDTDPIDTESKQRIERLLNEARMAKQGDIENSDELLKDLHDGSKRGEKPTILKVDKQEKDNTEDQNEEVSSTILQNQSSLNKSSQESITVLEIPEISFYPALKVFDPVAFFIEILLNKSEAEFKRKYLKMALMKVYRSQLLVANAEGIWELAAPPCIVDISPTEFTGPTWINEGRNEKENIFILPLMINETFSGAIGLVVPGQVTHEKMSEMEFWCFLGRCTCN